MEVIKFPKNTGEGNNIVNALRQLAKAIESGSIDATEVIWVVLNDNVGEMDIGWEGEDNNSLYHTAGVLMTAAFQISIGEYDEDE